MTGFEISETTNDTWRREGIQNGSINLAEENEDKFYINVKNMGVPFHGMGMIILLVFLIIVCFTGNALTCYVIVCNKHMRTTLNYYLFSMAISDFLLLVTFTFIAFFRMEIKSIPSTSVLVMVCKMVAMLHYTASVASIFVSVTISADRYIAVCHPFVGLKIFNRSRTLKIILGVWIFSLVQGVGFTQCISISKPDLIWCPVLPTFHFIIPMTINIIFYTFISLKIWQSWHVRKSYSGEDNSTRGYKSFKSGLRISVSVVIEFLVCWGPINIMMTLYTYRLIETPSLLLSNSINTIYLLSTVINPIIYSAMSKKFRKAFLDVLWPHQTWCSCSEPNKTEQIRNGGIMETCIGLK